MQYSGYQPVHHHQPMQPPTHHPAPPQLSIPNHSQHSYTPYSVSPSPATGIQVRQPPVMPQSPSESSERAVPDEEYFNLPGPPDVSHIWNGYIWALKIEQHPKRARMCGFGDKDRRPISPPPCIRLMILDAVTKAEIDYTEIELSVLVLTVDIWDLNANKEMNLVKQSNASPCISSAATGAYPTPTSAPPPNHTTPEVYNEDAQRYAPARHMGVPHSSGSNNYGVPATLNHQNRSPYVNGRSGYAPPPAPAPFQPGSSAYPGAPYQHYPDNRYLGQAAPPPPAPRAPYTTQLPSIGTMTSSIPPPPSSSIPPGMEQTYAHASPANTQLCTRNLIGSTAASAFRLKDAHDVLGIWFVLHDLSVRTEGWFRLKATLFNLSQSIQKQMDTAPAGSATPSVERETAPCLAASYSDPFRVYSAKKFPGVVESTDLSKAFANQGIKIPIRKDTGSKRTRDGSDDDDDGGED